MKKTIFVYPLFFLIGAIPIFAQQSGTMEKLTIQGNEVQYDTRALDLSFAEYDLFQIDWTALIAKATKDDFHHLSIELGEKHQWNVVLELNDLRAAKYREFVSTKDPNPHIPRRRAATYKGYTNNPGSLGEESRFHISEQLINGFVTIYGQEYFFEPLTMTNPRAPKDYFVVYRPSDVLNNDDRKCTSEIVEDKIPDEESKEASMPKKQGMMTTCHVVDLATVATWDMVDAMGSTSATNDHIAMVTNLVEGLYVPLLLEFKIVDQFAPATEADDEISDSDACVILLGNIEDFAEFNLWTHDLGQLWTQRDIFQGNDQILGCAPLGVVCNYNRYNLVQNYSSSLSCLRTVSAHEIGHNFNANHSEPGFIMNSSASSCAVTTFRSDNITKIENHRDSRNCLWIKDCCHLSINCDLLEQTYPTPYFIDCVEDAPAPDESLIDIVVSCGAVDIEVEDIVSGNFFVSIDRVYTVTDAAGNIAICSHKMSVTGTASEVTTITPVDCIKDEFTIEGTYADCDPDVVSSIDLTFQNLDDGNAPFLTVGVTSFGNGTFSFTSTAQDMLDLGFTSLTAYEMYPILNLTDNTSEWGYSYPFFNDLYLATLSTSSVTINNSATDDNPSMIFLCKDDPIYYHGENPGSEDHKITIRRRPPNFPTFFNPQTSGWLGLSLDGYTGNLQDEFPGYFISGWEYQLTIEAVGKDPDCSAIPDVVLEFQAVNCCAPNAFVTYMPSCLDVQTSSFLSVMIEAPLTGADIDEITSSSSGISSIDFNPIVHPSRLELTITYSVDDCSCGGEELEFEIHFNGCSQPITVTSEPLACCQMHCDVQIIGSQTEEECVLINGLPARSFCVQIISDEPILDIFAGNFPNDKCPVEVHNLEITQISPNLIYQVCGYLQFTDPNCTDDALLTLIPEVADGCCRILKKFDFSEDCNINEDCLAVEPDFQIIAASSNTSVNISLDIPQGQNVLVIDHVNNTSMNMSVGTIKCGPFAVDQNGNVFGGSDCNGITHRIPTFIDCRASAGEGQSYPYFIEIQWGDCVWILSGDFCDEWIVYPTKVVKEEFRKVGDADFDLPIVFPNPIPSTAELNFDLRAVEGAIKAIQIVDLYGRSVESVPVDQAAQVFRHRLAQPLASGVYFVLFHYADGETVSTKLVAVE